jgi:predicted RNase H-like HicB family nuclease
VTGDIPAPALPISLTLRAVLQPDDDGWIHAYLPALPGVMTSHRSPEEARAMLADAFREYLLALDEGEVDDASGATLALTIS